MIALMVYFFPAVVSLWIYESLSKKTLGKKAWLYRFAWNTLLINGACFAVKKWVLHTAAVSLSGFNADMRPDVACNYLIMAIPLAVLVAAAQVLLPRHARVELTDRETHKEDAHESQSTH